MARTDRSAFARSEASVDWILRTMEDLVVTLPSGERVEAAFRRPSTSGPTSLAASVRSWRGATVSLGDGFMTLTLGRAILRVRTRPVSIQRPRVPAYFRTGSIHVVLGDPGWILLRVEGRTVAILRADLAPWAPVVRLVVPDPGVEALLNVSAGPARFLPAIRTGTGVLLSGVRWVNAGGAVVPVDFLRALPVGTVVSVAENVLRAPGFGAVTGTTDFLACVEEETGVLPPLPDVLLD